MPFSIVVVAIVSSSGASCYGSDCAPWEVCGVTLGECGADDAPLAVCTGTCVAGRAHRLIVRAGGLGHVSTVAGFAGALELEYVPPVLGGHWSLSLEGATYPWARAGVSGWLHLHQSLLLGGRVAGYFRPDGPGLSATLRLDLFGWPLLAGWTPARYGSFALEAGALIPFGGAAPVEPFAGATLSFWLPPIAAGLDPHPPG